MQEKKTFLIEVFLRLIMKLWKYQMEINAQQKYKSGFHRSHRHTSWDLQLGDEWIS